MSLLNEIAPLDDVLPKNGVVRDRSREGAGKSEASWRKHEIVTAVAHAQARALKFGIGHGRGIVIDMHAGDGEGVEQPQAALFGSNPSRTTAELAMMLAGLGDVDVILCERDPARRAALQERWPTLSVLRHHKHALGSINSAHEWALVLNDPNGPRNHGVEYMQEIDERLPRSDFVIVINDGALRRISGVRDERFPGMRAYDWMNHPAEWKSRLRKRFVAVSRLIPQSNGFRYRVLVLANHLADGVKRNRLFEVI